MFHKSTKSLLIWFHAIWWMVAQKNSVSAKDLQKVLGLGGYQTGVLEVDEVFVGGKTPGKRGRGAEGKSLVAVAIEVKGRKTGRGRLEQTPDASASSMKNFNERNIELSSTIITDGWPGIGYPIN